MQMIFLPTVLREGGSESVSERRQDGKKSAEMVERKDVGDILGSGEAVQGWTKKLFRMMRRRIREDGGQRRLLTRDGKGWM